MDLGGGHWGLMTPPLKNLRKNWGVYAQYSLNLHVVDVGNTRTLPFHLAYSSRPALHSIREERSRRLHHPHSPRPRPQCSLASSRALSISTYGRTWARRSTWSWRGPPAACRTSLLSLVEASRDCGQGHRQEATRITLRPPNFKKNLGENPQTPLGANVAPHVKSISNFDSPPLTFLDPPLGGARGRQYNDNLTYLICEK